MNITSSKPVTVSEAKEMLEKRKEQSDLEYEQKQALDHAEKFAKQDAKAAQKLVAEVIKTNEKITEELAVKLVDIRPKKLDTLKTILIKDRVELNEEELNAILALLQ